jgi:hypothetical protein
MSVYRVVKDYVFLGIDVMAAVSLMESPFGRASRPVWSWWRRK